jgi:FkbM family methyltransferase
LGTTIYTDRPEFSAYKRAQLLWNIYGRTECVYIRRYLSCSELVIELGAGLGVSSAHIARVLVPARELLCAEANPGLPPAIYRNIAPHVRRRGLRARTVNAAVGRDRRPSILNVHADPLASRVSEAADATGVAIPAEGRSLQTLIQEMESRPYDLVCDIEGAEAHFIVGEDESGLRLCRRLIIELHVATVDDTCYTPDDLLNVLQERWGFSLVARKGPVAALARAP